MNGSYLQNLDDVTVGKDDQRVIALQKDGCLLLIGQNALSNDRIITDHNHKSCIAFHAWGAKGSWVVLCAAGLDVVDEALFTDDMIRFAAEIALRHSRSELKSVVYARIRDLFKPDGSPPGVFRSLRQKTLELP